MKVDIVMPKLGESIMEGTILQWKKKVGDYVKKDETLLEISTDKVDSEIPSPYEGTLVEILAKENETVAVGTVIARIETEAGAEVEATPQKETPAVASTPSPKKEDTKALEKQETRTAFGKAQKEGGAGRFYSPLVLNIARREGISMDELDSIQGTGRGGRVTKKDLLRYLEVRRMAAQETKIVSSSSATSVAASTPAAPEVAAPTGERVSMIPMDPIRKKIAKHMRESLDTSAHVYSVAECDMTRVRQILTKKRALFEREEGFKLTYNPFILWAVTRALRDYPRMNSSIEGENIIERRYVHLGMAVATERGLIVPVIKNADSLSFRGLARAAYDLAVRTRTRQLKVEDVEGATFSVTNPGVFGNIFGLPIINQPNVGILGVGAIKKRPVVVETEFGDTIAIRSMVYLSLSFDHRLIDGDIGGKFLQQVVSYLENFPEEEV